MSTHLYEVLERLIAFDTVSSHSDVPAMEYLASELDGAGFETALHRIDVGGVPQDNLVAWAGPPRPDGLIVSGHLDTVPVEGQPGWTHDPFRLEFSDDRLFGRGTSDMKGFLAQCAEAARVIDLPHLTRPLVFIFTADEEVGMRGAAHLAPKLQDLLGNVPRPNLAWIGEPTSSAIYHAHKCICAFEIKVHGRGGHSGNPELGVNSIAVMGKVIDAIGRLQAERRTTRNQKFSAIFPDAPYDVMNFGTIAGGVASNIIAEQCAMRVTYRSLPDADPLELYREIERRLAELDLHDYGSPHHVASISMGKPVIAPPMLAPRDTPLEHALYAITGQNAGRGAPFATDGAWFAREGIVTLICGPGEFEQAHQPNESLPRAAFESGVATIAAVVDKMCRRPD
ncbi:MAG TPA: M20 family metallopeptidase [Candidatus Binataceae bacterium]|jgi:acetylornithine deacetylase|nr:M20 family metallopeptidase [Candidatus Binataceae bacterium]